MFKWLLVLPGFGPAAELVAWRVPKGATFVVEQKDPITVALFETHHATMTSRPASSNRWTQVKGRRANSPRSNKAPQLIRSSTLGPGGRRPAGEKEKMRGQGISRQKNGQGPVDQNQPSPGHHTGGCAFTSQTSLCFSPLLPTKRGR